MPPKTAQKRFRLGEILIQQGRITPDQLAEFLRIQRESGKPLGQVLVDNDILTAEELKQILGVQLGIPHVWLRKGLVDPSIVHLVPKEKSLRHKIIPMFRVGNVLTLATADPHAIFVFDEIAKLTKLEVQPVSCRAADIAEVIEECYQQAVNIEDVMSGVEDAEFELVQAAPEIAVSEIAEMAEGSPVINLTNMILLRAIRDGASDIHIEPQVEEFRVRVRIDGILYNLMANKIEMHPAVVSRLKVMANLDIAERRIPQDGRFQVQLEGRPIDLRFSSMPGIYGEKVVLRILDKMKAVLDINKLGFDEGILVRFKALLRRPHGLILVCGPTGSGKTTTLYSAITMLNTSDKNILTIEDPVEYQLNNINQSQVRDTIGLNFAKFLKHALRQDPDIIMVGEIRDRETAEVAIEASLTGHLVLSTLHTNDCPTAVTRLLEMEIEPYLISSSVLAVLAQRLVRSVCPECKTSYYAPSDVVKELGLDEKNKTRLVRGKGCSQCYDSGFKGRVGIHELLEMEGGLKSMILDNPTVDTLQQFLSKRGHQTLRQLGLKKVLDGITTIEEIRRVTAAEVWDA